MSNVHRFCISVALTTTVVVASGCTINTFNCNVKESCRSDAAAPAAGVAAPGTAR